MKLARIAKPLRSIQLRVTLAGDLNAASRVTRATTSTFTATLSDSKALIPEILSAFLQADREFQIWSHSSGGSHHRRPNSSSSNGSAKGQS